MRAEQAAVSLDRVPPRAAPTRAIGRIVVVAAPVLYFVALTLVVVNWGLPLARDQLFFWLGLGMAAFSVSAWRSWGGMVLEWLPFFGLLVAYDFLRGAVGGVPEQAHVAGQIAFDKAIAAGQIPTVWLQDHLWSPNHIHWYDYGVWAVYMTHFFAVWIVAAVLWRVSRHRFRRYVALTMTLTLGAFLTYWLFPAQPPWLTSGGAAMPHVDRIVPLVWGQIGVGTVQSLYENSALVNTVAAMPSLHGAYPLMLMLFFWPAGWFARIGLGLYTLAMAFTLVYGGEHFVMDIVAGWLMALAAFGLVALGANALARRRAARVERVALPSAASG